jgi:hypothetical protein
LSFGSSTAVQDASVGVGLSALARDLESGSLLSLLLEEEKLLLLLH